MTILTVCINGQEINRINILSYCCWKNITTNIMVLTFRNYHVSQLYVVQHGRLLHKRNMIYWANIGSYKDYAIKKESTVIYEISFYPLTVTVIYVQNRRKHRALLRSFKNIGIVRDCKLQFRKYSFISHFGCNRLKYQNKCTKRSTSLV